MWTAGDSSSTRPTTATEWTSGSGGDDALEALLLALNGDPVALDIPLTAITGGFVVRGRLVTDQEFAGHVDRVLEELIRGADYHVTGAVADSAQIGNLRDELLALFQRGPFQQGRLRRSLARRRSAQARKHHNGSGTNGRGDVGGNGGGNGARDDAPPASRGAKPIAAGGDDEPAEMLHVDLDAFDDPESEPPTTEVMTLKAAEVLLPGNGWTKVGLIRVLVSQVSAWWLSGYSESPEFTEQLSLLNTACDRETPL